MFEDDRRESALLKDRLPPDAQADVPSSSFILLSAFAKAVSMDFLASLAMPAALSFSSSNMKALERHMAETANDS